MILSQGTQVYFADGTALYELKCALTLTPVGDPIAPVDMTPLGAAVKTSAPGIVTPSQFSVTAHYNKDDTAQQRLFSAYNNRDTLKWCILFPETTSQPSLSGDNIVAPANRTSIKFEGWLTDRPLQVALNKLVGLSIPVQRTTTSTVTIAA